MGGAILYVQYVTETVTENQLYEISGLVSESYNKNSTLFIHLENNTNRFGIKTFLLPDNYKYSAKEHLIKGTKVNILIKADDALSQNKRWVQILGLTTLNQKILLFDEYVKLKESNDKGLVVLGCCFLILGPIFYSQYRRLNKNQEW